MSFDSPPRLDLSDPQAESFCSTCGGGFVAHVEACKSCGEGTLLSRSSLLSRLEDSVRTKNGPATAEMLVPLATISPDELGVVRDHLLSAGIPFVLLDAEMNLLGPNEAESAAIAYVPASEHDQIQKRLSDWLDVSGETGSRADDRPHGLVHLCSVEDQIEVQRLGSIFEESGLKYLTKRLTAQLGVLHGPIAPTAFFVDEQDLGRAKLVLADSRWSSAAKDSRSTHDTSTDAKALNAPSRSHSNQAGAGSIPESEPDSTPSAGREGPTQPDDLQTARAERRYRTARIMTTFYAVLLLLIGLAGLPDMAPDALVMFVIGSLLITISLWSRTKPEQAFGTLFLLNVGIFLWGIFLGRPLLLTPGLFVIIAVFFAYKTAVESSAPSNSEPVARRRS